MTNLKEDLNAYLSRNESKNGVSISFGMQTLGKLFKKEELEETEDLLTSNQKHYYNCDFCPSLSRFQRIVGFCLCTLLGTLFLGLSLFYIPVLILKTRKFALMFTIGSCLFLSGFSFLWGPINYLKHIFSMERLPFTTVYISSLLTTLYCSLWLKNTPFTALSAVVQIIALVWFLVSYIPGGQSGLFFFRRVFSSAVTNTVSKTLPV